MKILTQRRMIELARGLREARPADTKTGPSIAHRRRAEAVRLGQWERDVIRVADFCSKFDGWPGLEVFAEAADWTGPEVSP